MVRVTLAVFGLFLTTSAAAQPGTSDVDPHLEPREISNEGQAEDGEHPAEPRCRAPAGQDKGNKSSLAKDAGGAAANTGGAIAGGAVAGPIGAAVGGVIADHASRAIGKVFGGKKNDREDAGNCREPDAAAAGANGALDHDERAQGQ